MKPLLVIFHLELKVGLFQGALNCPVLVCGPGNIAVAHKPNEFVEIDQMKQCDIF